MRHSDDLLVGAEMTDRIADYLAFCDDILTDTREIGIPPDDAKRWLRATVRALKQRASELTEKAARAKNRRRYAPTETPSSNDAKSKGRIP